LSVQNCSVGKFELIEDGMDTVTKLERSSFFVKLPVWPTIRGLEECKPKVETGR